jgi:hypothetical protein
MIYAGQSNTLRNKSQQATLLKFYDVLAVPVLLHGSKCWTLSKQHLQKIDSTETRFFDQWRAIKVEIHILFKIYKHSA